MNGVINVNKPLGMTSHDVVSRLRKILSIKKIGHTGTLDPDATGVLPMCVGRATKIADMLTAKDKQYIAEVTLGSATDTLDASGEVTETSDKVVGEEDIHKAVESFVGEIEQVPPMYSAIKIDGRKMYELAREGIEIERKPRRVRIDNIEILSIQKDNRKFRIKVDCSKGTYIRSLCDDIGRRLGTFAHMSSLVRTRSGRFDIGDAYSLEDIEAMFKNGDLSFFVPVDAVFEDYPKLVLSKRRADMMCNGVRISLQGIEEGQKYRVYDEGGKFLTLSEAEDGSLKILKTFYQMADEKIGKLRIFLADKAKENDFFKHLNIKKSAVALGQFDAVHKGHIEIINSVVKYARQNNITSVVYMFENAPFEVISGKRIKKINSLEKRFEIISALGVDIIIARSFDKEYMNILCSDFVEEYLANKLKANFVTVGYNYRFGKDGAGDTQTLAEECEKKGIEVFIVPEVKYNQEQISSTTIREKITSGRVEDVKQMTGRYFSVKGVVEGGNKIGARLGFPTANIEMPRDSVIPKYGVYLTRTSIDEKVYQSLTNVGDKPSVENDYPCIETYIDGFSGDIYGKMIEIEFCEYIREIKKFDSLDELKEQIEKDKERLK